MKNELDVTLMNNDLDVIEQNHKNEILSIHENMAELIEQCNSIQVFEDDKKSYDNAVELKKYVKSVHVSVDKKRKELKQPIIDYGKKLDAFAKEIYEPLVQAEKIVKSKMEVYEIKLEKLKAEKKVKEEEDLIQEALIENKIRELNLILGHINEAKSKRELLEIEKQLEKIDVNSFGKKSADVGFVLSQLKLTCSMAMRIFKDEDLNNVVEEQKPIGEKIPDDSDFVLFTVEDLIEKKTQEVLIKNEEGIFEEHSIPANQFNPLDNVQEDLITPMTDNDVINVINDITEHIFLSVCEFVEQKVTDKLSAYHHAEKKNVNEHSDLIKEQVLVALSTKIKKSIIL
jgi:hypothetical protein